MADSTQTTSVPRRDRFSSKYVAHYAVTGTKKKRGKGSF